MVKSNLSYLLDCHKGKTHRNRNNSRGQKILIKLHQLEEKKILGDKIVYLQVILSHHWVDFGQHLLYQTGNKYSINN